MAVHPTGQKRLNLSPPFSHGVSVSYGLVDQKVLGTDYL
jgi:hypothetical protein